MTLLHIEKVKENQAAFRDRVIQISEMLGINPNWLMQVMYSESGLNHRIENKTFPFVNGYATGLIQFTPDTALGLGTTVAELKAMSNVAQLTYVYKYFHPWRTRIKSFYDLYFVNFFPLALGKSDDWVFQTSKMSADKIATANPGFDLNKDKRLTVAEVKEAMYRKLLKDITSEYIDQFVKKKVGS